MAHGQAMTTMRYAPAALILAWAVRLTAATEHDPVEVLRLVTQRVLAGAKDIPNCICVQAVEREFFQPAAAILPRACHVLLEQRRHPTLDMVLRPISKDRLRLDVTMAEHGELFSWVGASKFDDAGIANVVRNGPIGSGAFGGFLMAVFKTDAKKWTFERNTVGDGRSLMEDSFQVLKSDSHYHLNLAESSFPTPYT